MTDTSEPQALPSRADVRVEETWDLEPIFASDDDWEAAFSSLSDDLAQLDGYVGRLGEDAETLTRALQLRDDLEQRLGMVYVYAHLRHDEDTQQQHYVALEARARALYSRYGAAISWFGPELAAIDDAVIDGFIAEYEPLALYRHALAEVARQRPHLLSQAEEKLLAQAAPLLRQGRLTFGALNNADFQFPKIRDEEGREVELSHARYGLFLESHDRTVREAAFRGLYSVYDQFRNTLASTLDGTVKAHNFSADVRRFGSAREASLFANAIPEQVYEQLVDCVEGRIELLHDYIALRRELLGLEELHSFDLHVPLVGEVDVRYSFEEARDLILEALRPLGDAYRRTLERAFSSRWIDYADNRGKRSGAYSSGSYGTAPYILMNWQGTLNDVYTLAHELGHSVHTAYAHESQPYVYSDYPIFLAEIASTTNERLLTEYLLQTETDPRVLASIVNQYLDGFRGTVFRQTQFAAFEQLIHQADREGTALTAQWLSEQYGELNRRYYGPALSEDREISLEWSRIPHFYLNFYVFQYATGYSAAEAFAQRILTEGQPAVDAYLGFLRSGSADWPLETLAAAGLDMAGTEPIDAALDSFARFLARFRELMAQLADDGEER